MSYNEIGIFGNGGVVALVIGMKPQEYRKLNSDTHTGLSANEAMAFSTLLRAWRISKGLTQDELAELSGVSKSTISQAERASHTCPPKEITQSRLAAAMGITMNDLRTMPDCYGKVPEKQMQLSPTVDFRSSMKGVQAVFPSPHNLQAMSPLVLPSRWILGATDEPGEVNFLVVSDSAMNPTLSVGDVAIVEPCNTVSPGLFLVGLRSGNAIQSIGIRRVTPSLQGAPLLSCDNERFHQPIEVDHERAVLLSKVVFVVRAVEPE